MADNQMTKNESDKNKEDNPFEKMHFLITTSIFQILKLLIKNGFHINHNFKKKLLPTIFTMIKTIHLRIITRLIDKIVFTKKMLPVPMKEDPIFIIGHWRSGTSVLHDYLCKDPNFSFADTFQNFFPKSFISYERVKEKIKEIFPRTRPQDGVKMDFDYPFEDEFALAFLSEFSMYHGWWFPNKFIKYFNQYVLFKNINIKRIEKWKKIYQTFIQKVYVKNGRKPLILKNPVNTARINTIKEIFPKAKFIFIHRNPVEVYYSTIKVHQLMIKELSLQNFKSNQLNDWIITIYNSIHNRYIKDKKELLENDLVEICYEDFIADPISQIKMIYNKLNISSFQEALPEFKKYQNELKDYKKTNYSYSQDEISILKDKIKIGFDIHQNITNRTL